MSEFAVVPVGASLRQLGGKSAVLVALAEAGLPVPPGFALPADAFLAALEPGAAEQLAAAVDAGDPAAGAADARAVIMQAGLPARVAEAVDEAYRELSQRCGVEDVPVAVRSSAVGEDRTEAAAAGVYDSFLGVRSSAAVRHHVLRCWAGVYNERAIAYRRRRSLPGDAAMGVAVQRMVPATVAGVAFTVNPLDGDDRYVAVEASWGLGESVVSGVVTPDFFLLEKATGEVVRRMIATKDREFRLADEGAVVNRRVSADRRGEPCLDDDEVRAVARLACRAEALLGAWQDVEWAIDRSVDATVWLLQSRPETVWQSRRPARAGGGLPS
jgi:pyruvate,water dikinase